MLSRRSILAASLAAPAIITGARAAPLRKVRLTLPWLAEGSSSYAFVAKANGYWADVGLDVEITRGYGSVAAAQAVGGGQFDFGLAAASAGIQMAAKALPVVAITCCGYDATMCIAVLGESPIHAPKDLAGKSIACTVNSGEYPFLPAYTKAAGIDLASMRVVQTDPNVRQRLLMERQVDCISGFAVSIAPVLTANNIKFRFMPYSDAGLKFYNNVLLTRPEILKADPALCEAMVTGINRAVRFCLLQPADALAAFVRQVPETNLSATGAQQVRTGMGIFALTMLGDPAKQHGVGASGPDDYAAMTDLVMRYAANPDDHAPDPATLYTNQFAGPITLTEAEWAKAADNVKEFRDYFA